MNAKKRSKKLYNFWIGPLLVGSCLATGYEATHRFMVLRSTWKAAEVELLENRSGVTKKKLKKNFSESIKSLQSHKNPQSKNSQKKYQQNLPQLRDKEMQKLLHALKTSLKDPHKQKDGTQSNNLNLSNKKAPLEETTFDELFKTLPKL